MYIKHVEIRNFRAVENVGIDLSQHINVIVGPNGVGKTTILQAIRVIKALVAPRTQQEVQQVLISLNAASPHFPQRVFLNSLARDVSKPVEIRCAFVLADAEVQLLQLQAPAVIQSLVSSQMGQNFQNPALLIQFMQSPQGQAALATAKQQVSARLGQLQSDPEVIIGIKLNPMSGEMIALDPISGTLISFLDQSLPPSLSYFSYFPADRALPLGEVNLQLGGPDVQQQLEMHNSQPQIKYQRLKHILINSLVVGDSSQGNVRSEFEKIFSKLLKGRAIESININEFGLLSVMTREVNTGKLVELDALSSGEKNIALTFLIVSSSLNNGGIALFDEPELHLNPAVSADLLAFIMDEYSVAKNIQFLLCTHSPEILSGAFASDKCALLHLKSPTDVTRVGRKSLDEYSDALHRLGTSVSDSLLYDGTVFVEGDDDVAFLQHGYPELFRRYKIRDRGGRREIEKTISSLQKLEERGQKVSPIFLILDRDEEKTSYQSSASVKVMQWTRRSIDNYLIDESVISQILKDEACTRSSASNDGDVSRNIRKLAFSQIPSLAARDIYGALRLESPSAQRADFASEDVDEIARRLVSRAGAAKASLGNDFDAVFQASLIRQIQDKADEMRIIWESKWKELCDGKKLISDLHKASDMRISESAFRTKIVQLMRSDQSENWTLVKGLLERLLAS